MGIQIFVLQCDDAGDVGWGSGEDGHILFHNITDNFFFVSHKFNHKLYIGIDETFFVIGTVRMIGAIISNNSVLFVY
jgi:hypothetical protein